MQLDIVKIKSLDGCNVIIGTSHFIKSVEDLHEAMVNSVPGINFGIAFCESSGPCLVRSSGNNEDLLNQAIGSALKVGAGHSFIIFIKDAYPINVLNAIKTVPEVCTIHCATANPVDVLIIETEQGRGIVGIVDGFKPKGTETKKDVADRKSFLRKTGYKI